MTDSEKRAKDLRREVSRAATEDRRHDLLHAAVREDPDSHQEADE